MLDKFLKYVYRKFNLVLFFIFSIYFILGCTMIVCKVHSLTLVNIVTIIVVIMIIATIIISSMYPYRMYISTFGFFPINFFKDNGLKLMDWDSDFEHINYIDEKSKSYYTVTPAVLFLAGLDNEKQEYYKNKLYESMYKINITVDIQDVLRNKATFISKDGIDCSCLNLHSVMNGIWNREHDKCNCDFVFTDINGKSMKVDSKESLQSLVNILKQRAEQ